MHTSDCLFTEQINYMKMIHMYLVLSQEEQSQVAQQQHAKILASETDDVEEHAQ